MELRIDFQHQITQAFENHPVVALLGPRQCGKTTLSRLYTKSIDMPTHTFDLEDPTDLARLKEPKLALTSLSGLIIIDEVQYLPNLFPYLRVLVDRSNNQANFLILGSASRDLIRQSSETLAGRIAHIELTPFSYTEVDHLERLWLRGGFPKSYLAKTDTLSVSWRQNYIMTFLERDLPSLGITIPPQMLRRFWSMLSHYHGNIFNSSELGRSLDISSPTVQRYLDILTGVFMVRQLHPWFANIKKRQVKSPKIFFRDSGLLHTLLGINSINELTLHPKVGSSWEGMVIEEIIRAHHATQEECYFWSTHQHAELDLLIFKNGKKRGYEIKYTAVPKITRSMRIAQENLELDTLAVIYPGDQKFKLDESIYAIGIELYLQEKKKKQSGTI